MAYEVKNLMEKIVEYMDHFNRPFNANNLVDEFAKHAKKSVVLKAMEELEKNGSIQKKMFGKIKIYLSDQRKFPCPSEEELADLQSQLDAQKATLEIVTPEVALLSSENDALIGQLSDVDLAQATVACKASITELKARLQACRESQGVDEPAVSQDENPVDLDKTQLDEVVRLATTVYKHRKRKCMRVIDDASHGAAQVSREELMERIGIDLTPPASPS